MNIYSKILIGILLVISCIPTGIIYMLGAAAIGKKIILIITVNSLSELWLIPPIIWIGMLAVIMIAILTIRNAFSSEWRLS